MRVATVLTAAYYVTLMRLDLGEVIGGIAYIGVPLIAGVVIGRWWAVGLPILMLVSLALFGDGCLAAAAHDESVECDINWWALLTFFYLPITMFGVAFAVGARKLGRHIWRDYVRPTPAR